MTWRTVHASVVGTSHVAQNLDCDDDCWAAVDSAHDGVPALSIFVADGAGSASRGGSGARLAIEVAARFVSSSFEQGAASVDEALATACIEAVRKAIAKDAESSALTPRDYACTFLGLISLADATLAFQVGDGGMAIDVGSGLEVPIQPMQGEYANMTNFVTDEDAMERLQIKVYASSVKRAGVFSDGVQRLAMNLASNTPHEPFFAPFFRVLATAREDQEEHLQLALRNFLGSEKVNERTDDDKSLALAVWVE